MGNIQTFYHPITIKKHKKNNVEWNFLKKSKIAKYNVGMILLVL